MEPTNQEEAGKEVAKLSQAKGIEQILEIKLAEPERAEFEKVPGLSGDWLTRSRQSLLR